MWERTVTRTTFRSARIFLLDFLFAQRRFVYIYIYNTFAKKNNDIEYVRCNHITDESHR